MKQIQNVFDVITPDHNHRNNTAILEEIRQTCLFGRHDHRFEWILARRADLWGRFPVRTTSR
jgi:hypothetical protein